MSTHLDLTSINSAVSVSCHGCRQVFEPVNSAREGLLTAFKNSDKPRTFFDTLKTLEELETFFPEVHALTCVPAGPEDFHEEGSAYEHTMMVLEECNKIKPNNVRLLLAGLSHDFGKGLTDESELPNHPKHTKHGKKVARRFGERLGLSDEYIGLMETAARYHMRMHNLYDLREATLIRMVEELSSDLEESHSITLQELVWLGKADNNGGVPVNREFDEDKAIRTLNEVENVLTIVTPESVKTGYEGVEDKEKLAQLVLQDRIQELKTRLD